MWHLLVKLNFYHKLNVYGEIFCLFWPRMIVFHVVIVLLLICVVICKSSGKDYDWKVINKLMRWSVSRDKCYSSPAPMRETSFFFEFWVFQGHGIHFPEMKTKVFSQENLGWFCCLASKSNRTRLMTFKFLAYVMTGHHSFKTNSHSTRK